jgi:hypothetical protein
MTKRLPPICVLAVLILTACDSKTSPTPENYTAAINGYYVEHSDCLLDGSIKFPLETTDPAVTKQMDSLVVAQILEVKKEPSIHIARFTRTDTGTRAGTNLCYGHRQVTKIVSSTTPAAVNGVLETNVTYGYKMEDTPIWAKTPEVQAAFPKMAQDTSGQATATIKLAQNRITWVVP